MKNTIASTLENSPYPYKAIPFDKIPIEELEGAIDEALVEARKDIQNIKDNLEPPNFENTIARLDNAGELLDQVTGIFFNLLHACTHPLLDEKAPDISQKLAAFGNDIQLDSHIFSKIQQIYDHKNTLNLTQEELRLLEITYLDFVRNGALLKDEQKEQLRKIDKNLSGLSPAFNHNLLQATNSFHLFLDESYKTDVEKLPASSQAEAKSEAEKRDQKGWVFTLQAPSYIPFMKYMPKRELRQKMWLAYNQKAYQGEFSNKKLCEDICELRRQRAKLLGYASHAHFALEKRMAKTPQQVFDFLDKLKRPSIEAAQKDLSELQNFVNSQLKIDLTLEPWDFSYYSVKYKEHLFQFNEEDIRPYFPLDKVLEGLFLHGKKLYNLDISKIEIPSYHSDVETFEVTRNNTPIGLLYIDLFPRDNKRAGAWMTQFVDQKFRDGKDIRPHVSIVCNFTKPSAEQPSLLTFNEVQTLFHEFGHGLHGLLSQCHYSSLSGTSVHWDFVELPSQILENWTYEKESLDLFASHYETQEPIPMDLIKKIQDSAKFQAGYASARQLSFSYLDMLWHSAQENTDILAAEIMEEKAFSGLSLFPKVPGTNFSVSFSHIFAGGYSAGYYSYKWAEVLDADAFELFKEKGIFNPEVAKSFCEEILERGGTQDPMELYKKFRGREPDPSALMRRSGFL